MALNTFTFEHYPNRNQLAGTTGGKTLCFFSFKGDSSWAASGEAIGLDDIGMATAEDFQINDHLISGGVTYYKFVYDRANAKIVAYLVNPAGGSGDEITEASTADLSTITLYGSCFGTPLSFNG